MEKQYFELFNKLTDIIEELKQLQIDMEEMYINADNKKAQWRLSLGVFS